MGNVDIVLQNMEEVRRQLRNLQNMPQPVMQKLTKEFKQRAPSWIAKEVTQTYNIKKAELTPAKASEGNSSTRKASSVTVRGRTIRNVSLVYKGRLLTPTHFGMTPKKPSQSGNYTIKMQVKKGQKKTLSKVKKNRTQDFAANFRSQGGHSSAKSPVMLMHIGGGVNHIPFQRVSQSRNALEAIKTISVPQMIDNPEVNERIYSVINTNIGKRLQHYMDRYG